jgi:hypothetical protein
VANPWKGWGRRGELRLRLLWIRVRGLDLVGKIELALKTLFAVVVACIVVLGLLPNLGQVGQDPLMTVEDGGQQLEVRPADGCLATWHDRAGKTRKMVLDYCTWRRPQGVGAWVPVTKELYHLDAERRHVVELVAFGLLPDGADSVRYTLPGGEIVEAAARHHDDLDGPAYWIHLRQQAIPVDMAVTDGATVFTRFQVFDAAGQEIPVV